MLFQMEVYISLLGPHIMNDTRYSPIGYGNTHKIVIYFEGVFQDRLATNPDPSNEKRGVAGWTFAHYGEPDLDRIIRFNNPISERICADHVGVYITRVNVDSSDVNDSLIGQMVNLGPESFFDGSAGAGDGFEPIIGFEFHVGNNGSNIISASARDIPRGTGAVVLSKDIEQELGIDDMDRWKIRRMDCLNSISLSPGSKDDILRKERIDNIMMTTGIIPPIRESVLGYLVRYPCVMDKDIYYDPQGSLAVEKMKVADVKRLFFNADFFSYDGDGLVGHVKGTLGATFIDEK
jgi:hypothetical protein